MIRVAIIGAGFWGPNLIRLFDNRKRSVVRWVVDRDPIRLEHVRQRFPESRVTGETETALADPDIDAVVVATPSSTHHALAKAALEQGKHVLVEKPIATSSEDGQELCRLAQQVSRVLMVGHVFLYNAGVRRVKEYLDAGELGRPYYIAMTRTNLGPVRMDVNAAWDLAAHDVSIGNYWLGDLPMTVSAVGGNWINPGIEDVVFATLRYPNDVLVNLHTSWLNPRKIRDSTVVGERRMLTLDDMDLIDPIRIYDKGVAEERITPSFVDTFNSFRASIREGDVMIPRVVLGEALAAEVDHFLECISEGRQPLSDGQMGVDVVHVLEAMARSMAAGGGEEPVLASPVTAVDHG